MPMRPASSTCRVWMKPWPSSPMSCVGRESGTARSSTSTRFARPHAELVFLLAGDQAGRAALDDEGRDPLGALGPVGHGHHDQDVGRGAVRDEALRAVEHPVVAVAPRGRAHGGRVAARSGLGQAPGGQLGARRERGQGSAPSGRRSRRAPGARSPRPLWAATDSETDGSTRASSSSADAVVDRRHAGAAEPLRESECPSGPGRPASAAAREESAAPRPTHARGGAISASANARTARRSSCCSLGGRKSMGSECITAGSGLGTRPPSLSPRLARPLGGASARQSRPATLACRDWGRLCHSGGFCLLSSVFCCLLATGY